MITDKFHTLTVNLPPDLEKEVVEIHKMLAAKFSDQYAYFGVGGMWIPHLAVYTILLDHSKTEEMIRRSQGIISKVKALTLQLDQFVINADKNYIFLNLDESSTNFVLKLHSDLEKVLLPLNPNYVSKHPYSVHFSMIKLNPTEAPSAIKLLKNKSLAGRQFRLDQLTLTKQSAFVESEFPILAQIPLGK